MARKPGRKQGAGAMDAGTVTGMPPGRAEASPARPHGFEGVAHAAPLGMMPVALNMQLRSCFGTVARDAWEAPNPPADVTVANVQDSDREVRRLDCYTSSGLLWNRLLVHEIDRLPGATACEGRLPEDLVLVRADAMR